MVERTDGNRIERALREFSKGSPKGFVLSMQRSFQPNIASRRNAFTLIELLVVIAIIAVLASLIVGLAGLAGRKSKEAQVRAQMNGLITAIDRYKSEFGYYPPDNVLSSTALATNV